MRFSELTEPIRELSEDKVPFNMRPEYQTAFTQMKQETSSAPVLAYYNPKKQTMLQTDASRNGLGACLLQEEKLVYFANKALTVAQKGYVAIEIDCLQWLGQWRNSTTFYMPAISSFHQTDLKLLEAILSKILYQATPGLQWILLLTISSRIYTCCYKPACRLFVQIRW